MQTWVLAFVAGALLTDRMAGDDRPLRPFDPDDEPRRMAEDDKPRPPGSSGRSPVPEPQTPDPMPDDDRPGAA